MTSTLINQAREHDDLMATGVLYSEGKEKAAEDMQALINNRQEISDKLNTVRLALKEMIDEDPPLGILLNQLKADTLDDLEQNAVELWLKYQNSTLPLIVSKVRSALQIPTEVKEFVDAVYEAYDISIDPGRYWDKTERIFKPIPISKDEKEHIKRRNMIYGKSVEHISMYETLRPIVGLINLSNQEFNSAIYEGKLNDIPWIARFVYRNNRSQKIVITENNFFLPRYIYSAFDEENAVLVMPTGKIQPIKKEIEIGPHTVYGGIVG